MAFTGTHSRSLDEKFRVAIPKPLREAFAAEERGPIENLKRLYVAPGTDASLVLYSDTGFAGLADQYAQGANSVDRRNFLRMFYSRAEQVDLDSQGRIRIPERLVAFAKLGGSVILAGVHDHAEVWDKELWDEFLSTHTDEFDRMASQI